MHDPMRPRGATNREAIVLECRFTRLSSTIHDPGTLGGTRLDRMIRDLLP